MDARSCPPSRIGRGCTSGVYPLEVDRVENLVRWPKTVQSRPGSQRRIFHLAHDAVLENGERTAPFIHIGAGDVGMPRLRFPVPYLMSGLVPVTTSGLRNRRVAFKQRVHFGLAKHGDPGQRPQFARRPIRILASKCATHAVTAGDHVTLTYAGYSAIDNDRGC